MAVRNFRRFQRVEGQEWELAPESESALELEPVWALAPGCRCKLPCQTIMQVCLVVARYQSWCIHLESLSSYARRRTAFRELKSECLSARVEHMLEFEQKP